MRPFEYAAPTTEADAVALLSDGGTNTTVLAGGTDLLSLMQRDVVTPDRVINLKEVESLRGITADGDGIVIGAMTTFEELRESPLTADYRSLADVVDEVRAIQIQQNGTVGGDLCLLPNCWFFRNGYGLLGSENGRSLVEEGDNRYHAIFDNAGPAKYVNASRLAPALIAWDAQVRVVGPKSEQWLPLEQLYVTPRTERQRPLQLEDGQLITHIRLAGSRSLRSAAYEVLQTEGLDWPLAAASATVAMIDGVVREARVVMGHVGPRPMLSEAAAQAIVGYPVTEQTADRAGAAAVELATPLSCNDYKVQLAKTAVKRALLRAVGREQSGAMV